MRANGTAPRKVVLAPTNFRGETVQFRCGLRSLVLTLDSPRVPKFYHIDPKVCCIDNRLHPTVVTATRNGTLRSTAYFRAAA
jgi:hypothetical protein